MPMMKVYICIVLALVGAATARNVFKMDIPAEEDRVSDNDNALFFSPQKEQQNADSAISCKDPKFFCTGGRPCCEKPKSQNGTATPSCCRFPQGVCCPDGIHCCPKQSFCDMARKRCYRKSSVNGLMTGVLDLAVTSTQGLVSHTPEKQNAPNATTCKDPKYFCSGGRTCCEKPRGQNGTAAPSCCPFPQGVCCPNGIHCCPRQSFCDMVHKRCFRKSNVNGLIAGVQDLAVTSTHGLVSRISEKQNGPNGTTVCKDPKYFCTGGRPCCEKPKSQNGTAAPSCCRFPQGVCCPDGIHCCPQKSFCDMLHKRCFRRTNVFGLSEEISAMAVLSHEFLAANFQEKIPKKVVTDSLTCPDGSKCPNGESCCKDKTGAYACCPLPEAVCCNDQVHCCPKGYKCETSNGICSKGTTSVPMAVKKPSVQPVPEYPISEPDESDNNSVPCPGGAVSCPSQYTCCEIQGGGYGCCPLSQAVCCADHVHCCPHNYRCDLSAGTCSKGDEVFSWFPKQAAIPHDPVVASEVQCPDGNSCPSGQTCCENMIGKYACCPLPEAVCCSDKVHCCPNGYTCDVSAARCNKGNEFLAMSAKQPSTPAPAVRDVTCADQSTCPDGNTCCEVPDGGYGCCPLPNAVCCSDKVHCCPEDYTCDIGTGTCSKGKDRMTWFSKMPVKQVPALKAVTCPDGSSCDDRQTCCEDQQGGYACCPIPKAVCCSDKLHCCPEGYTCDVSAGRCNKGNRVLAMFTKQPSKPATASVNDVTCPDQSTCPSQSTCCEDQQGHYECCPLPSAVCCSDKLHCCPSGSICDVAQGKCNMSGIVSTWSAKHLAKPAPVVNDVVCPDHSSCPSDYTCCESQQGDYACCPLPEAVCCSDKVHCCPDGYTCDVSEGRCNKGNDFVTLFKKQPATPAAPAPNTMCPDQKSTCPSDETCCEDQQGGYACCPLPKAVCCSDKLHCCPDGYTCDVSAGRCNKGNDFMTLFKKQPATPAAPAPNTMCPDQKSTCPNDETCCEDQQGGYACCPVPKAVCCSDKLHCCPDGYTCDVTGGRCNKGNDFMALFKKQPATPAAPAPNTMCPDQKSTCPSDETCCENQQGGYACCPLPKAVCCSDKLHCCPDGYTCDVSGGRCNKGNDFVTLFKKQPATPAAPAPNTMCPDQKSTCQSDETCCENQQGGYACCPLPKAVCCSDKLHCCPDGYTCDVSAGRCNKGNDFVTLFKKQPATPAAPAPNAMCPDQKSTCPSDETCCEDQQGGYACCPLPKAVCCSDKLHCCPDGYTCDVSGGRCNKGNDFMALFKKQPATPAAPAPNTMCPDQKSTCPNDETCCEDQQGGYACCPVPKAVCCSDKLHCCPDGYTCDVAEGRCTKGNDFLTLLTKQASTPALAVDVVCPDQKSSCPSGQTCCENQQGGYSCCPLLKAVCCADKLHCCPNGYTCDVAGGRCNKGNSFVSFFKKQPATLAVNEVICPDKSTCPSFQTCCQNHQGGYGCCPLPYAVCCSDKLHCCPRGYTCDVAHGTCRRGNDILSLFSKRPANPAPVVERVTCPDQSTCPDGETCCENQQGGYGCCPSAHAVCCPDQLHCCPEGYTCDVAAGTCNKGNEFLAIFTKRPSSPAPAVNEVTCPDQSTCPGGETCCENQQGGYSCCPLSKAVCCSDKLHCCPDGYTCDVAAGRCNKGNEILNLFAKHPSKPAPRVTEVRCPDGSECHTGMTCCENKPGGYGCCPLPYAVCCADRIHCCPHGWECGVDRCIALGAKKVTISWFSKLPAKKAAPFVKSVTCPDKSTCADGNTCCDVGDGKYGCCPTPNAVCCADRIHFCPQNTVCDLENQRCTGSDTLERLRVIGL